MDMQTLSFHRGYKLINYIYNLRMSYLHLIPQLFFYANLQTELFPQLTCKHLNYWCDDGVCILSASS